MILLRTVLGLQTITSGEHAQQGIYALYGEYGEGPQLVAWGRINVDLLVSAYVTLQYGQVVFDKLDQNAEDNIRTVCTCEVIETSIVEQPRVVKPAAATMCSVSYSSQNQLIHERGYLQCPVLKPGTFLMVTCPKN
ncbi:MAG: hypothetical protein ACYCZF_08190 [Anaerolineae bacterium]